MPRLTNYQFDQLTKTEQITILCGPEQEPVQVHKGFVVYHSGFLACLISKPSFEGTIELPNVGVTPTRLFARWCYEGRLETFNFQKLNPKEAQHVKHTLIDLWIFSNMHSIPKLQNQAMTQLRQLFTQEPTLITTEDVQIVFEKTTPDSPLRTFVILILIVKIDLGKEAVEKCEMLAQAYPGFFTAFAEYQRMWLVANGKVKAKEKPEKLGELLESEEVVVVHLRCEVPVPPEWVLVLSGVKPKPREAGEPVEVIELD